MLEVTKLETINPSLLRESLRKNGYLFIPGFFATEPIHKLAEQLSEVLIKQKWGIALNGRIKPSSTVHRLGGEAYCKLIAEIMTLVDLHALPLKTQLHSIISTLLNAQAYLHPRKIVRITYPLEVNPNDLVPPHQDLVYVKGEVDTLVAWIPLGNYTTDFGPLRVAQASHKLGLLPTQANAEGRFGCTAANVEQLSINWQSADYKIGDLLIMHSLLMHSSLPNNSEYFRISFDCRFSDVTKTINSDQLYPPYYPKVDGWDYLLPDKPEVYSVPDSIIVEEAEMPLERIMQKESAFI
jgi:ectoine hydroxylase-related dioxygenase (phytanoyl-CoA dioxygenase family)